MFENLTQRLTRTLKNISGKGRITEENIKDTLREVRTALLEADVALPVVKSFTNRVKERALGAEVNLSLSPGQEFIKAVHAELIETLGGQISEINLAHQPPAVILLAGLQGAGKTTSAAKLALFLKERMNKKVLLVSVDTYRPAAMDQLKTLAVEIGVDCYPSDPKNKPEDIATAALKEAKLRAYDVMILDTAGRLAVDEEMMNEVKRLHALTDPIETFFTVDAMTGQDAANTAKAFGEALDLTGVILTKADGDARGGAVPASQSSSLVLEKRLFLWSLSILIVLQAVFLIWVMCCLLLKICSAILIWSRLRRLLRRLSQEKDLPLTISEIRLLR